MQPKSFTGRCSGLETESNCDAAMRRGEQLEVRQRPARKKLDSATNIGEPPDHGRSLNPPRRRRPAARSEHVRRAGMLGVVGGRTLEKFE